MSKTVLFQIIQFSISTLFSCICGPPHMDKQRQDNQLEPIYNSVPIQDVALKTYWE